MDGESAQNRLIRAEQQGLRLAIFCRTLAIAAGLLWFMLAYPTNLLGYAALIAFLLFGIFNLVVIGTRYDRWWLKYAIYGADIIGICALFAMCPLGTGDVPQIMTFRAYGIHYLLPLVAMACLSLSWRLVAFSGVISVIGWWAAFGVAVAGMERRISWLDMDPSGTRAEYERVFLSMDFIGTGNRVEETGLLLAASLILALAVFRARRVFFAQVKAEADRAFVARTFGEYVPPQIAERIIEDRSALAPQTRHATVMSLDIAGFTKIAEASSPEQTIGLLNEFFTEATDVVSETRGVVVDFSGDGFLATFNAPLPLDDHERSAVDAARRLLDLVAERQYAGRHLNIRLGLTTGEIAGGSVGGGGRRTYTIHGDKVNLAARLQDMAKTRGVPLLMDGETASKLESAEVRLVDETQAVRGREGSVSLYTLVGLGETAEALPPPGQGISPEPETIPGPDAAPHLDPEVPKPSGG
ncbi:MAG: adenylate/guanylate cyclase domain-containing protein [Rhodospirillales bacterium]|nr:adenylate/guanylate cyclase domain-containing protein [Rhodospirillales bacterium]